MSFQTILLNFLLKVHKPLWWKKREIMYLKFIKFFFINIWVISSSHKNKIKNIFFKDFNSSKSSQYSLHQLREAWNSKVPKSTTTLPNEFNIEVRLLRDVTSHSLKVYIWHLEFFKSPNRVVQNREIISLILIDDVSVINSSRHSLCQSLVYYLVFENFPLLCFVWVGFKLLSHISVPDADVGCLR